MAKRYPHPDGPKRYPGEVHEVAKEVAELWVERGIVSESVSEDEIPETEQPNTDPTGQPPESPEDFAQQPNGDLRKSTVNPEVVVSNFDPPDGVVKFGEEYAGYADLNVPEVLAKVKTGEFDGAQVLMLENQRDEPRKGITEELKDE